MVVHVTVDVVAESSLVTEGVPVTIDWHVAHIEKYDVILINSSCSV